MNMYNLSLFQFVIGLLSSSLFLRYCSVIGDNCSLTRFTFTSTEKLKQQQQSDFRPCFDFGKTMAELEKYADVILTGTVDDLRLKQNEHNVYTGIIRVRRIFKGWPLLFDDSNRNDLRQIFVHGFYDSNICESRAHKKDTKIFFLNQNPDGSFRLNSSLMAVNLRNLDTINALAKEYKDPCTSVNCQFGASCVVSPDGKTARCVCPERCYNYGDSRGSRPVCGDDGRDYESLCHIRRESCKQRRLIRVKYVGLCDPCAHVDCPEGTICKLNDQREPTCRCSEQCHLDFKPVCASDGNSYRNPCIMLVQACKQRTDLRVYADGLCENIDHPCKNLKCDYGEQCYIDTYNQSSCQCLHTCERIMRPVCGKNGVTYDNECALLRAACKDKERNTVEHQGVCGSGGACADYECAEGAVCLLKNGQPECQCPACGDELDPVCGSNGVTYPNECKLRHYVCKFKKNVFVKYRGFCDGCLTKTCDYYAVCVSDGRGGGECKCTMVDDCEKTGSPVCGTDGITYENECQLKALSCKKRVFVMVAYKGRCDACVNVQCAWGARCEDGSCVCPAYCPTVLPTEPPVCGSDGVLYPSLCHMLKVSCAKGMRIRVENKDRCPEEMSSLTVHESDSCECKRIGSLSSACDSGGRCHCKPGVAGKRCDYCVSGFWGIQNGTGCIPCGCSAFGSLRQDCEQSTGRCMCKPGVVGAKCNTCLNDQILMPTGCVSPEHYSSPTNCDEAKCYFGGRCEMMIAGDTAYQCTCSDDCSYLNNTAFKGDLMHAEVCGSDGKTYSSACQLYKLACKYQNDIVVSYMGRCQQSANLYKSDEETTRALKTTRHLKVGHPDSNEKLHLYVTPRFIKNSWIEFTSIEIRENSTIELKLKPRSTNGLVYFCGDFRDGLSIDDGKFLSLALIDGYFEVRYNFGAGVAKLRSSFKILQEAYYRLKVRILRENSTFTINNDESIFISPSKIPLEQQQQRYGPVYFWANRFYLGVMPLSDLSIYVYKSVNVSSGYTGCVLSLRINGKIYDLRLKSSMDILNWQKIEECEVDPCSSFPCLNDGVCTKISEIDYDCHCVSSYSGLFCETIVDPCASYPCHYGSICRKNDSTFSCECGPDRDGRLCEKEISYSAEEPVILAEFSDKSFAELCTLPVTAEKELQIEIWFKPYTSDGLLFSTGLLSSSSRDRFSPFSTNQKQQQSTDYFVVRLLDSRVLFAYDLGSGAVNISSELRLPLNAWSVVRASRYLRNGSLEVNNGPPAFGKSPPPAEKLNIGNNSLFVGHVKSSWKSKGHHDDNFDDGQRGFSGVVQRLIVNGQIFSDILKEALVLSSVGAYVGPPCIPNPCIHSGTCVPKLDDFECKCALKFIGKRCDKETLPAGYTGNVPIFFNGHTRLKYRNRVNSSIFGKIQDNYYFKLKTNDTNGVILWESKTIRLNDDYLALSVFGGRITLSYNLGKEKRLLELASNQSLMNNKWHNVRFWRDKRHSYLSVDDETPLSVTSNLGATELNTDGYVWLGGIPQLPYGFPKRYSLGYIGCIGDVKFNGRTVHLISDCLNTPKNLLHCTT